MARSTESPTAGTGTWRLHLVNIVIYAALLATVARLVYVQIIAHEIYKKKAEAQYQKLYPAKANRGNIYDRNGIALALNKSRKDLVLHKEYIKNRNKTCADLASLLQIDQDQIRRKLRRSSPYVVIARGIGDDEAKIIEKTKLAGVTIEQASERLYPFPSLAQVIGFTHVAGNGGAGIEIAFEEVLQGKNGWNILQQDARGRSVMPIRSLANPSTPGSNIVLTIDHVIQAIVEEELISAVDRYNAKGGTIIMTNPVTGEILALASSPGLAKGLSRKSDAAAWRLRGVADMFEPGSTFKVVTMMLALSEGKRLSDTISCEGGKYTLFGEVIHDTKAHDILTVQDAFIISSNIAAAKIAMEFGKSKFYKAARNFGFGIKTGIELPGETPGILKKPVDWSKFTIAAMAYGHEIAATSLQMAMAYGAVANGGLLMRPAIVKAIVRPDESVVREFSPEIIRRVMPAAIAEQMTEVLAGVVESGTGTNAQIPGVRIAGKTGTAQKPKVDGRGYSSSNFIASFAGFYPTDTPKFLMFVMLDEPFPIHSGGAIAAPTFKRILERVLRIYERSNGPPTDIRGTTARLDTAAHSRLIPNLVGRNVQTAEELLSANNLTFRFKGAGDIVAHQRVEQLSDKKSRVVLTLTPLVLTSEYATMPDLTGFSMRRAVAALSIHGINARIIGSGKVVQQTPEENSKIRVGAHALLECQPPVAITALVH